MSGIYIHIICGPSGLIIYKRLFQPINNKCIYVQPFWLSNIHRAIGAKYYRDIQIGKKIQCTQIW